MSVGDVPRWNNPLVPKPPDVGHFLHAVQFYEEGSFLLDELCSFIGTALVAGDGAVVVATKAQREGLAQRFLSRGLNTAGAVEQGRFVMLDAFETLSKFMVDDWPDAKRFADSVSSILRQVSTAAGADRGISVFGEMVAVLWSRGNPEAAIYLEQLWNDLAKSHPISLRCAYPMNDFNRGEHGDLLLKICAEHSHVIPVETYTALISDEQKLRSITRLQQKARALETEMAERKIVEESLRRTKIELESIVEERTLALRQLSSRLLTLQDTERRRIARELHDSLGQYLVGLKLYVDMLRKAPEREQLWVETDQLMEQCIIEVRTLSYLLHPPTMDAAGFDSAARWYVDGFSHRSGLKVTLAAPEGMRRLPDALELALFRVLQESLTNVHRHSGASAAEVLIEESPEEVVLEVRDNGNGIAEHLLSHFQSTGAGMGVGLAGIRERTRELGGTLKIEPGRAGTLVRVAIPLTSTVATTITRTIIAD